MTIGQKARKGFTTLLYRNILEKIVGMGAMVILARNLTPYDFGLVSITDVLLIIISTFGTTGVGEFLLAYRKDDVQEIFNAAFWFSMVMTLGICALFLIAAPFWAHYNNDDRIWKISLLLAIIFLFSQLQGLAKVWLSRNLMFETQVRIQTPFIFIVAIGKVVAVYMGLGVYSLLIPSLITQPILTFLFYRAAKIKPGLHMYTYRWREIYHFTKHLIGASILARISDHGDRIILGRFLGLSNLGVYNVAVQMADLVTTQIVTVSNNILSSVLPKYVHDKDKFYQNYIGFLKVFAFLMFPILGIMMIAARPIILFLYGPQWMPAILPMQILLVYAAIRCVTSSYGSVINSFHLNKVSFRTTLIYTPFHIVGSIAGSMLGVVGIASSVVLVKTLFINISIKQIMNAVGKPVRQWYIDMGPYFLNVALIICVILPCATAFNLFSLLQPINSIVLVAFVFAICYYTLFRVFFSGELQKISVFTQLAAPKFQLFFNYIFRI